MKSVKEIKNIIRKLQETISSADKREKEISDEIRNIINSGKASGALSNEQREHLDSIEAERDELYQAEVMPQKLLKIWKYNLYFAFMVEFIPVFYEVMTKYQGKNIGEKTREKIRNEFNARGLSVYFYQDYSRTIIGASYLEEYYNRFEFYAYNAPLWDENNKLLLPALDGFKFEGQSIGYIENPKRYIKELEKLAEKLHTTAGLYAEAMKNYNRHAIPGTQKVEYQNSPESTYSYFRVWNF